MKKIGLYLDSVLKGGTFQYNQSVLEAVLALPLDQYKPAIFYTSDLWKEYLIKKDIIAVKIERTYFSRAWFQLRFPLWCWRNYSRYLDNFTDSFLKQNCDLWLFPSQDIWSYSLPINSLSAVHDLMHRYENKFTEAGSKKEYFFRELHYKRTCNFSNGIMVDSELGRQQLIESYNANESKIHILPYIAPKYIFEETENDLTEYNLPDKFIFYPAQFWKHKNHNGLVKAASKIIDKIPNLKIVLVGAPNNGFDDLLNLINKMNLQNVFIFLDHVPDEHMRELYLKARALVMPTFFGPTNIPPLEAFATGCPVAISNVYAMPEQVADAGILFDPNSEVEIANAIYLLWTDDNLVQELSSKGNERSQKWRQEHFNNKLLAIINRVLHQ